MTEYFRTKLLRHMYEKTPATNEVTLVPAQPVRAIDLINNEPLEPEGLHIATSPIHPFYVQRNNGNVLRDEFIAVVQHPIGGDKVLKFLNKVSRVVTDIRDYTAEDVADDWARIASAVKKNEVGGFLDVLHQQVHGFDRFIPHLPTFLGALNHYKTNSEYELSLPSLPMLPLIWWEVFYDAAGKEYHRDFQTGLIPRAIDRKILKTTSASGQEGGFWDILNSCTDTFAGMCIPAYLHPEIIDRREEEQTVRFEYRGDTYNEDQEMRIAQSPVHNYQWRKDHFGVAFMQQMEHYILQSVR